MLGLRGSIAIVSDVSRRLFQSVSVVERPLKSHNYHFHGVHVQSLNIKAGTEIPDNKPLKYALQYIRGIGRARAGLIISELNMTNKLAKDLTRTEVVAIGDEISKYIIGRDLATIVERDIKRMKDIQCYKGIRHIDKLPCRGQRTSTNARTRKANPRIAVASSNKVKNK